MIFDVPERDKKFIAEFGDYDTAAVLSAYLQERKDSENGIPTFEDIICAIEATAVVNVVAVCVEENGDDDRYWLDDEYREDLEDQYIEMYFHGGGAQAGQIERFLDALGFTYYEDEGYDELIRNNPQQSLWIDDRWIEEERSA